uniref:Zgc:153184 n=1 Tax=Gadus morhua TaxID=8049 RepID=A0A8C5A1D9_GADMO
MLEGSPFKSVAELAGRFRGHTIASPTSNEERIHLRKVPCALKLSSPRDEKGGESQKPVILLPKPFKVKIKKNSIIEKLQANLALSPSSLFPLPRTPEVKLRTACAPSSPTPVPSSPGTPRSSPPPPPPHIRQSSEEEEAVCFESPPEGNPLPSFNKTRARLSVKRRPPTRRHRQSQGEEGAHGNGLTPWQPEPASPGPEQNEGKEASERMSQDPTAPLNQSERREENHAQRVGDEDTAENAEGREADLATLGGSDASEDERRPTASAGICSAAGKEEITAKKALQQEERETA